MVLTILNGILFTQIVFSADIEAGGADRGTPPRATQ